MYVLKSMLLGGRHPSKFSYFQLLRRKFAQQMTKVAAAEVLISAFGNQDDYLQLTDITLGFKVCISKNDDVVAKN